MKKKQSIGIRCGKCGNQFFAIVGMQGKWLWKKHVIQCAKCASRWVLNKGEKR
jgi:DNA-directed RNA polymerase subunit RPC12/RpoP